VSPPRRSQPTVEEMGGAFSGPDSVEWLRAQRCTTHHQACDCLAYDAAQARADATRMAQAVLDSRAEDLEHPDCVAARQVLGRWGR
jgi:hypothetical protein